MKKTAIILFVAFGIAKAQVKVISNGNVGIGTTSPSNKVNIDPVGPGGITIGNSNRGSGGYTSLELGISANQGGHSYLNVIRASGSAYGNLIINQIDGNVAIGNANPSARFNVEAINIPSFFGRTYHSFEYGDAVKSQVDKYSSRAFAVYNYRIAQIVISNKMPHP